MIVSISPPHYFPSAELLHKIILSDVHVVFDTISYIENSFIDRCKIQTPTGWKWLNVPVLYKLSAEENINNLKINSTTKPWAKKQLDLILLSYKKAPFFKKYYPFLEDLLNKKWEKIIDLDLYIYDFLLKELQIQTKIIRSSDLKSNGKYMDQIMYILEELVADIYLAENNQRNYLEAEKYREKLSEIKVKVKYCNYTPYQYKQLYSPFEPLLSVLDIMMNHGSENTKKIIMKNNLKKISYNLK